MLPTTVSPQMEEPVPTTPLPPFYETHDLRSSPYFLIPTFLLVFITLGFLFRWLSVWPKIRRPSTTTSSNNTGVWRMRSTRNRNSSTEQFIYILNFVVVFTLLTDLTVICARSLIERQWTSTILAYYDLGTFFAFSFNFGLLIMEQNETGLFGSVINRLFWWLDTFSETYVAVLWYRALTSEHGSNRGGVIFSYWDYAYLCIFLARLTTLYVLSFTAFFYDPEPVASTEPLLSRRTSAEYGTFMREPPVSAHSHLPTSTSTSSQTLWQKFQMLLPFIWPHKSIYLQFLVIVSFGLLILGRIINILVPLQLLKIVDILAGEGGQDPQFPLFDIALYVALRFLQGGVGLIQSLQNYLWIPIGQYTTREISVKMFGHLHALSLAFHVQRKTGEVLRVMDRGTNSIIQLLSQILFQIFPTLVDIALAVVFFIYYFSWLFGGIVLVTMILYVIVTIAITEWRTKYRREMIELDNNARTKAVDSLLNFETVKYYTNEDYEVNRYDEAIQEYQRADWKSSSSLNVLNLSQNAIITAGLAVGLVLCAYDVSKGKKTVGQFVLFLTYIMQLYGPLNFFGTYYRMIQANFIDMEKMLALFREQQSVKDKPDAPPLSVTGGVVKFENVSFTYDKRQPALQNISFTVPTGQTVALVGPSGGGKSTILRLLFRFYDVDSGRILIDGQDIRDVTQKSLRQAVGVVPQDTVLFNDTIMYNIRYGNVTADDNEVFKAAKAAQIHERVLSFPDGYETRVGERGLRLSGGEKQRVAIARTILKNPPIILLDEATSALDTTTERQIQYALQDVTANRTTLVIAHRLSTIVNADLILCIKDGRIVESGTHEELINEALQNGGDGVYYEMWQKQLREEDQHHNSLPAHLTTITEEEDEDQVLAAGSHRPVATVETPVEVRPPSIRPPRVPTLEPVTADTASAPTVEDPVEIHPVDSEPPNMTTPVQEDMDLTKIPDKLENTMVEEGHVPTEEYSTYEATSDSQRAEEVPESVQFTELPSAAQNPNESESNVDQSDLPSSSPNPELLDHNPIQSSEPIDQSSSILPQHETLNVDNSTHSTEPAPASLPPEVLDRQQPAQSDVPPISSPASPEVLNQQESAHSSEPVHIPSSESPPPEALDDHEHQLNEPVSSSSSHPEHKPEQPDEPLPMPSASTSTTAQSKKKKNKKKRH